MHLETRMQSSLQNLNQRVGRVEVYFGPMGSGKTTRALEQVSQFCALNYRTLYVTSKLEEGRASSESVFYSHNPESATLHKLCSILRCESMPSHFGDAEVIVIDEAQFFSNLVEVVKRAVQAGKDVQVYGLCSDFKGEKFGSIIDLIPFADAVLQMTAKCIKCSEERRELVPAPFTDKVGDSSSVVEVGAIGKYLPVCRKHHTRIDRSKVRLDCVSEGEVSASPFALGRASCADEPILS